MPPENSGISRSEQLKHLLALVTYADMYNYALQIEDLKNFWGLSQGVIMNAVAKKLIQTQGDFVFLKNRESLVENTRLAEEIATDKAEEARTALDFFFKIPWIKFIGLSGSIGARNAKESDDYDVFLIVEKNSKWLVRALELYFALIKKNRATKAFPNRKNTICANVYVENLELPAEKRNLFVAYQCLLVMSLKGEEYYKEFLSANTWIQEYFPNLKLLSTKSIQKSANIFVKILNFILSIPQKSKIILGGGDLSKIELNGNLFFHPLDPSNQVINKFTSRYHNILKSAGLDE